MDSSPKVTFTDLYDYIESMSPNVKLQTTTYTFIFNQSSIGGVGEYFKTIEIRENEDSSLKEDTKTDINYMHSPYYFQIIYRSTDTTINRKYYN